MPNLNHSLQKQCDQHLTAYLKAAQTVSYADLLAGFTGRTKPFGKPQVNQTLSNLINAEQARLELIHETPDTAKPASKPHTANIGFSIHWCEAKQGNTSCQD